MHTKSKFSFPNSSSIAFSSAEKIRSHFGALMIDGIKVKIMGNVQKRLEDGSWEEPVNLDRYKRIVEILDRYKRIVEIEGMRVPRGVS